jgi:hypothetical protein
MSGTGLRLRRVSPRLVIGLLLALCLVMFSLVGAHPAAAACGNAIACENQLAGDPPSDWDVNGIGDSTIQGFATSMSVNAGQTESFKISSTATTSYHIDILRVGYYQGNGARKVVSNIAPTSTQTQPACKNDTAATGLIDCGNWAVSASWAVPSTAVSGLYLAHLVRNDTGGSSIIPFVVRNDASHSDILVQTSDETWQAYNSYGGNSLYTCGSNCPPGSPEAYKGASKVSYNRPWHTPLDDSGRDWWDYAEYDMIRFLEENGYDVSYTSGLDVSTNGSLLLNHKIFLSSGHDEYWTGPQVANVTAARDAGVSLAFFSGNEVFWKTRWEPSIDGSNTPNRTLVAYKETHYDTPVDPQDPPTWTGTWADPRFSPPADGGRPQNALTGQLFVVNSGTTDITVPSQYSKLRFWRNTRVATLASGQSTTLDQGVGTLGYEWDVDADNGYRPAGLMDMSSTTLSNAQAFTDYGSNLNNQPTTHHLTLYRATSGALVFGAGSVQWAWGLDSGGTSNNTDSAMQQATLNLLADMSAQPTTLMSGITAATQSTDTTAPTSTITSPSAGASLSDGSAVTVSGTAADTGGGVVAGVEVSTDGGSTWRPATTVSTPNTSVTWTYSWVAHGNPSTVIKSRAVDDSGNLQTPGAGTTVTVNCPCSIWGTSTTPRTMDSGATAATEVGVKFKTDAFGYVIGIRFYKASTNTGTHIGNLWTASGQLLATATFTGESGSGWQQVNFSQPVAVNANTTYVASYFAPRGHYSQDNGYLYTTPELGNPTIGNVDSPPLHALRSTNGVVNGVLAHAASSTFPTSAGDGPNYWVDPVFTPQTFTTPPGQVTNVNAVAGFASASLSWNAPTSGDPVTSYTITPYVGSAAQTPTTITGNPTTGVVNGLTNGTTYTFTVTASNPVGSGPASAQSNAVTPLASLLHINNGGFESGLTGWTTGGGTLPTASSNQVHSGSGSALLGTVQPGAEPNGDSNLSQTIAVPSTGTSSVSFWYWPATTDDICSGSGCVYDWQEAQIRNTSGATLASVFKSNSNSQKWTQITFDLTPYAGQNVVLWFNVHLDGASPPDDTWMYLDDVTLANSQSQPTAPGAPTGVTATAGNASATVSWTAPSSDGGSTITKYTVMPFIGSTAQTPVTVTGSPPPTSTTVTGLTNGTAYTFTVTATNAIGTGPASAQSNSVTPSGPTVPGAPTGVTATAGNGSATVSFTAPASNGGSPITSYTVTASPGGATATGSASPITVTGLTNGTAYTFTVTATNAIGTGPPSAASNAVTPTAVGPITVDKTVFTDGSGTMTSPSLTTTTPNDLIVAFVSSDGPASIAGQSFTVTGAGLAWTLAKRSNAQLGDSEVWWARASGTLSSQTVTATPSAGGLHGSLVVVAFAKAAGIGVTAASSASSGAPDLPLANTGAGSWVYAVGNDWDNAIARTPVSGQAIVHQRVDTSTGDTFWVQSTTAPNASAGTVDIHDSAPTTDLWNYAGVEILPGS